MTTDILETAATATPGKKKWATRDQVTRVALDYGEERWTARINWTWGSFVHGTFTSPVELRRDSERVDGIEWIGEGRMLAFRSSAPVGAQTARALRALTIAARSFEIFPARKITGAELLQVHAEEMSEAEIIEILKLDVCESWTLTGPVVAEMLTIRRVA